MDNGKEAGAVATDDKSPDSTPKETFQVRFNARLTEWKKEGCPTMMGSAEGDFACGKPPHRSKMIPKDERGIVVMSVDCSDGHEAVWTFEVTEDELKADLAKATEAAAAAVKDFKVPRDPMRASLFISMDLKTQEIDIDSFVPTPGMGIQLAGILTSYFFDKLRGSKIKEQKKIITNDKSIVHPVSGQKLVH